MKVNSGRYKGTTIKVGRYTAIRPTTGKIREWIFQILKPYLPDSRFLDLFAGTGIMGIEANSRGCRFAVFVDNATGALIRQNLRNVDQVVNTKIINEDVLHFLRRRHPAKFRFHIINADPPYDYDRFSQLLKAISQSKLLVDGGFFVLEHGRHSLISIPDSFLTVLREKTFGETKVTIFKKGEL